MILARDTVVLAGARGGVKPLERRQARTDVVILGPMRGTPYDYVSPRNACESGFVEQSVLKKLNPR